MKNADCSGLFIFGAANSSNAEWVLVDCFDGYDNEAVTTLGANDSGDCTAGVWDGTGNAHIYDNADDSADNELGCDGVSCAGLNGLARRGNGSWKFV